jgi:UDP-N-acetylmuramoyl-tripeptide--D-alanyl-D-alanine ligase
VKFEDLAVFLKIPIHLSGKISKFCFDSREVIPGAVFFALKGEKVDGHSFLPEAQRLGASLAIVDEKFSESSALSLIPVESVRQTLQNLAKSYLASSKAQILALTGSLGKTTTKCFVDRMLSEEFKVASTPKSYNSQLGLPLSILNMSMNVDKIVLEMGMSEAGNISRLVEIASPDITALIGVDFVHIGNFSGVEGVAFAKAEIFKHPKTKVGLLFDQVPIRKELMRVGVCKKLLFSLCDRNAAYFAETQEGGLIIYEKGNPHHVKWNLLGEHNHKNYLAAVALCRQAGLSWKAILRSSTFLELPSRRLQLHKKSDVTFINDTYNACLSSVKAALDALPLPGQGAHTYLVFGEMVDLGSYSHMSHEEVGKATISKGISDVFCLGNECRVIEEVRREKGQATHIFTSKSAIKKHLKKILKPGDVVLFKGANKHSLWELEEELRGES